MQECHYFVDKLGAVDFASPGTGKVSKPAGPNGPLGLKTLPILGLAKSTTPNLSTRKCNTVFDNFGYDKDFISIRFDFCTNSRA